MKRAPSGKPIEIDVAALDALIERLAPRISADDHVLVASLVGTLLHVHRLLRADRATLARLRGLLGITSSEKTSAVLPAAPPASPPGVATSSPPTPDVPSAGTPAPVRRRCDDGGE